MTNEALWQEFGCPKPPKEIWQKPFDFDPAHLLSLCERQAKGQTTDPGDLYNYAEDLSYVSEIQRDLLLFLLPPMLRAWSANLSEDSWLYSGFAERFWMPWNGRPELFALLSA